MFGATFITFFLAEMGDKTQIATVAMSAHYADVLMVVAGTTLGMLIADVPAVFAGDKLATKIPMKLVHRIAAAMFAALWMQAVAALHSAQLGLSFQDFVELGYGCVARQHHLEYKRPTFAGDMLWVATWISHNEGKADMTRQYQFVRESDQATVMQGHTQWVCIDMKTGRPKKQPPRFVEAYRAVIHPN